MSFCPLSLTLWLLIVESGHSAAEDSLRRQFELDEDNSLQAAIVLGSPCIASYLGGS